MQELGKTLIWIGGFLVVLGIVLTGKVSLPWFGRLPGDFLVKKENFTFYFPLTTSILLSIVLTLIFYLFRSK